MEYCTKWQKQEHGKKFSIVQSAKYYVEFDNNNDNNEKFFFC